MIGSLVGKVLFSDKHHIILQTDSGVGYQVHFSEEKKEGTMVKLFITHIVKEASQELFGFNSLREKKLFELLNSVKGVGPKSAFSILSFLGGQMVVEAIQAENKKTLTRVPGIGVRAASQIILDLGKKIERVKEHFFNDHQKPESLFLREAVLACKELGFDEDLVMPIASQILSQQSIQKSEELLGLVLREI